MAWRGKSVKRKREVPWIHTFVCLLEPEMLSVPHLEESRFYEACGIGKKVINFHNNMGDHTYLTEHLYSTFPPLRDAGGYILAKSDRGKRLIKIPIPPLGYSIQFLRHEVDIKRAPLYIIPLQRGLTLNTPIEEVCPVMERCLNCDKDFPLFELQGHFHLCQKNEKHCLKRSPECPEEGTKSDDDEDLATAIILSLLVVFAVLIIQIKLRTVKTCENGLETETSSCQSAEVQIEESPILIPNISNIDTQSTAEIENELDAAAILQSLTSLVDEGTPPRSNYVNVV
ncbi:uncharacterized protein LOC124883039 [Girardinichthys multiradiatus]|uniref:uncharacterized protein LOC124883039 n=1 Tax=Girardinichthys multiradiatus TaxID=208333 RepID=UPI001FAC40B3|nr:uncharacterized protein LOC124883039 [Girardinichthys multiradiatus]XP_047245830.1 uncharacterized protein LOC124883039 [Girardinichthys multiradiatus]